MPPTAACDRVTVSSTPLSSSAALAVTVCSVSQVVAVKVRLDGLAEMPRPAPATVTVTRALGCVFRRIVYVRLPFSGTVRLLGLTRRLGVSSSVAVTSRSAVSAS